MASGDDLIRQLERNAQWNSFAAPCRGCALAASELRLMRQRVDGLLALSQEVKAYLRHIRRKDGEACRCDVCAPVNDLIAQIDRASEGEP